MYSVTFEPRFPGLRFAAEAEEAEVVGCQTSFGECSAEKCCYDNYGVIRTSVRVLSTRSKILHRRRYELNNEEKIYRYGDYETVFTTYV